MRTKSYKIIRTAFLGESQIISFFANIGRFKKLAQEAINLGSDPSKQEEIYEQKLKPLENYANLIKKLASRTGLSAQSIDDYVVALTPISGVDEETLVSSLLEVVDSSASSGMQGKTTKIIDYFILNLKNTGNAKSAVSDTIEGFKKINELSPRVKLSTQQLFEIFYRAVGKNDFSEVYALISIAPLMNQNFMSTDKKVEIDLNAMNDLADLSEKFQQAKLDITTNGLLVRKSRQVLNDLKIAWLPIKKYIDTQARMRIDAFNTTKKNQYISDPARFKSQWDLVNQVIVDIFSITNNLPSLTGSQAPGTAPASTRGSSKTRKIKIVTSNSIKNQRLAAPPAPSSASGPAQQSEPLTSTPATSAPGATAAGIQNLFLNTVDEQRLQFLQNMNTIYHKEIEHKFDDLTKFLSVIPGAEGGLSQKVFTSAFDTSAAMTYASDIISKINKVKSNFNSILTLLRANLANPNIPAEGRTNTLIKLREEENDKNLKELEYDNKIKNIEQYKKIIPKIRNYSKKEKEYKSGKNALSNPTNPFFEMKIERSVAPGVKTTIYKPVLRPTYIHYIYLLGLELVNDLETISNDLDSLGFPNAQDTAENFRIAAQDLLRENNRWKTEVMKAKSPSIAPLISNT